MRSTDVTVSPFELNNRGAARVAPNDRVSEARLSRGRSDGYARGRPVGRYDGRREGTRLPASGLARPVASDNVRTATAAVVDPWGDGVERVLVTVNRRVDVLEQERSHTRISEAAYRTGRLLQAAFERMGGVGSANWLGVSRQDPMIQQEMRVINSILGAQEIEKMMARVRARLGMIDSRLLKRILGDRMTFAECAEFEGKNGERGASYIAARFREALEDLAEAWTAKGAAAPVPADKHAAASETVTSRQEQRRGISS